MLNYRIYVTDCQRAQIFCESNVPRYAELIGLVKHDDRSGDEIVDELFKKFNWRR